MQNTSNLNLKKPEGTDLVDINDLNDNADIIDGKFGATSGHGHSGAAGDGPKITTAGLAAGAATDAVIGNRTIADTTAPTADTAAPTTLLSGLGNMIKQITGGSTWRTAPAMTIAAIKAILDAAVSAATANAIIKRDASGRAQVAAPSAAADIARKDTVDAVQTNLTTHAADTISHLTAAERTAWNAKAPLASPALAGTPTAPTALVGTRNNQIATTLFVDDIRSDLDMKLGQKLPMVSPEILGTPTAFTAAPGTNTTQLATTAYALTAANNAAASKANLSTTPQQTTADITYYVRTDGNDANTGLANTAGGAFKTIGKAISMIPQVVNHTVAVNVAAGTYAEDVIISGTNGAGYVAFNGTSASIRSFTAARCNRIVVSGFTATSTTQSAFYAYDGGKCDFTSCTVNASNANTGITFFNQRGLVEGCTISNRGTAIHIEKGQVTVINCTGTGNATAILPSGGALVNTSGTIMSGALDGANGGVLNPWGDNTWLSRSFVFATQNNPQTLAANVFTKVIYGSEGNDNLGEYNPSTGVFTVKVAGIYTVSASIQFTNATAGSELKIAVGSDSGVSLVMSHTRPGSSGYTAASGSASIGVAAGGTLAIWATSTANVTTNPDGAYSYLTIIRTA